MQRTLVVLGMSLTTLFASFGFAHADEVTPTSEDGVVFAIDGVGGVGYFPRNLQDALAEVGVPYQVRHHYWSHGYGRWYKDLSKQDNVERYAEALADSIIGYKVRNPGKPVYVIARSGGTAIALEALKDLPEGSVERVVLLSSGLSPSYDLSESIPAVRTEMISFWSRKDSFVLGLGTKMFGTVDRERTDAAGRVGFSVPEDEPTYDKLEQVEWQQSMGSSGNRGTHLGTAAPRFLQEYVAPYIE